MKSIKILIISIFLISCSNDKYELIKYAETHLKKRFEGAENLLIILPDKGCNTCNFKVLEEVKEKKSIIIIITGYSKKSLKYTYSKYEDFSNIIYLTKPFSKESLIFKINKPSYLNYSNQLVNFSLDENFEELVFMIENIE
ncbi:hypothetical protein K8354_17395 [Polaribacter litorisediminis]|uniref:hypothetical protein n=1 Tax=Polaribacter litorisediminis TaxID=1908341 RepID=UPI001CBD837E|nr:hypothetical protein [Polaribacter litorisediminis]UAM98035.1 hypothetical protein K8354_17395 [Polaribacter litorisediminis]